MVAATTCKTRVDTVALTGYPEAGLWN